MAMPHFEGHKKDDPIRNKHADGFDVFLSVAKVAEVMCVSTRSVYRLLKDGELRPDGAFHGKPRIRYSQVVRYMEGT